MKLLIFLDDLACAGCRNFGIFRSVVCNLEAGFVCHVVLQDIEDKAFLDSLMHAVNMERMEAAVFCLLAEHFQSGILRCCSEREEGKVLVLAVSDQLADELVLRVNLIFGNAFDFCIFLQHLTNISKRGLQLLCAAAGLGGVCLITDDGEVSAVGFIHFFENHRELLQGGNNDTNAVVQCLLQILRVFAFTNSFNGTKGVVKSGNGCLQLCVQNSTVSDNDNTAVNSSVFVIVQGCQTIC